MPRCFLKLKIPVAGGVLKAPLFMKRARGEKQSPQLNIEPNSDTNPSLSQAGEFGAMVWFRMPELKYLFRQLFLS
jgi:hypothetical protein